MRFILKMNSPKIRALLICGLALIFCQAREVYAADPESPTVNAAGLNAVDGNHPEYWKTLEKDRQERIRGRLKDYERWSPEERLQLQHNWQRYKDLSPERRELMDQRFQRWQRLSPEKKRTVLERHQEFQQLTPEQQQLLFKKREQWQKLSLPERRKISEKYRPSPKTPRPFKHR